MTTKAEVLRAIRQKCLDCSCHHPSEVRDCRLTACSLWPFRFGPDPEPSRGRGFAKRDGYTEGLPEDAPRSATIPPLPRHSPNPSSTRAVLERGMPSPPLDRTPA